MIARAQAGVTLAEAQSQIDAHNAALEAGNPEAQAMADAGFRSIVVPLHADHVAAIRPMLLLVQAGALVLLADRRGQPRQPAPHPRQRTRRRSSPCGRRSARAGGTS